MQQPLLIDMFSGDHIDTVHPDLMEVDIPYQEVESQLEEFLQAKLAQFHMVDIDPIKKSDVTAKWRYSSAMQKSIRRGYVKDAIKYALGFHSVDATGFWIRLVVVAFEDIGVGGVWELALTLAAARSKTFRRK